MERTSKNAVVRAGKCLDAPVKIVKKPLREAENRMDCGGSNRFANRQGRPMSP